jgi:polyketide biosynthesis enoyl-CoA hydratase PksI
LTTLLVSLQHYTEQIAIVTIEDKINKNAISLELVSQLREVFKKINSSSKIKVVLVAGYDTYFLNGATKKTMIECRKGGAFDGIKSFFTLLLDCPLPTIAAMEGNAFGGGLCFGLFADMIVMAEESQYSATFMQYGYTPGDGATFIVPKKMGDVLGCEMLVTGQFYKGKDLKNRGTVTHIVKKDEVVNKALKMAKELAVCPRTSLLLLKEYLATEARLLLPKIFESETTMQKITLEQPEVLEMINLYMV